MIVTCPDCGTKFNLPDDKVQPGAQLRCSVCKHVFGIPDAAGQMPGQIEDREPADRPDGSAPKEEPALREEFPDEPGEETTEELSSASRSASLDLDGGFGMRRPQKRKSRTGLLATLLLLAIIAGGAGVFYFKPALVQTYLPFLKAAPAANTQDMLSKITLRGVRQYSISNEKLGMLSIIEGKAVNGFAEPRELIKVEASLYDKDGKVLDTKQQVAGTQASLFQLQVLSEKDLDQTLNNKVDILTYNINVPPGGEVPFMIVFFKSPENATEFGVKVIEAKLPPKTK